MPFTPFHFGPHACVALPLRKYIDMPVFILSNVAVDLEPLAVLIFNLDYPLHGYCHTFLFGTFVGAFWAAAAYLLFRLFRKPLGRLLQFYTPTFLGMLVAGISGVWLHVLFDAPLYSDIRPFFPFSSNPLYKILSSLTVHKICIFSYLIALGLVILTVLTFFRPKGNMSSS